MTKKSKTKKRNLIILTSALILAFLILGGLFFSNLKEETAEQANKTYCTSEQRGVEVCTTDYAPVCGWFDKSIKCLIYPCADTYSNPCSACINSNVEFYTPGECPK